MAERDPRVDPMPGDELLYAGREPYLVVRREGKYIVDTPINPDNPDFGEDLYHNQAEWELFYRTATIISKGEEKKWDGQ